MQGNEVQQTNILLHGAFLLKKRNAAALLRRCAVL
jgi:hypothetical protein